MPEDHKAMLRSVRPSVGPSVSVPFASVWAVTHSGLQRKMTTSSEWTCFISPLSSSVRDELLLVDPLSRSLIQRVDRLTGWTSSKFIVESGPTEDSVGHCRQRCDRRRRPVAQTHPAHRRSHTTWPAPASPARTRLSTCELSACARAVHIVIANGCSFWSTFGTLLSFGGKRVLNVFYTPNGNFNV